MRAIKDTSRIRSFLNGITEKLLSVNSEVDDEDEYDDTNGSYDEPAPAPRPYEQGEHPAQTYKKPVNNVINFNRENMPQRSVEITDPANVEDAAQVVNYLSRNIIVTVNLENIEKQEAQRVADFVCGAAYALGAAISRISNHIFLITPNGTGVSGGRNESDGDYDLPKVASYR